MKPVRKRKDLSADSAMTATNLVEIKVPVMKMMGIFDLNLCDFNKNIKYRSVNNALFFYNIRIYTEIAQINTDSLLKKI